jgi:hypothetical protein
MAPDIIRRPSFSFTGRAGGAVFRSFGVLGFVPIMGAA